MTEEVEVKVAKKAIEDAEAVLITAGAGMGVDSGLPDFRGNEGFWNAYPIAKKLGLRFYELANPLWFEKDPSLAWAFYGHRLKLYRETNPHEGFYLLKKLTEKKNDNYFVITSNVDGQFQKAGFNESKIVEIHGSIHHLQCTKPCSDEIWSSESVEIKIDMENFKALPPFPKCINCKSIARPNILMFNDPFWIPDRTEGQKFRLDIWLEKVENKGQNIVIIEIGAGKAIPTIRYLSESITRKLNGFLIRINPRDYDMPTSTNGVSLKTGGLEGLKMILDL